MANKLQSYFPMIRTRDEILRDIRGRKDLAEKYDSWNDLQKKEFLDFCTGVKGVKLLYDAFFKEVMDPDAAPERLEELLSLTLEMKVKILKVLPNESPRIADEQSLVIMDIIVELEGGSIADVEVQKQGYAFPGQRSACYSADMLLRQYKRVKSEKREAFSYRDIQKVYTIVLFEKSTKEFHKFPQNYIHHSEQKTNTGIELELLQEYTFIALDIFQSVIQNNGIENMLEVWLAFLSIDDPDMIIYLSENYPKFKKMYQEVYDMCRSTERVMGMYSEELRELDRNTVQYMIDEMQNEIDAQKNEINAQKNEIDTQKNEINAQKSEIDAQKSEIDAQKMQLDEKDNTIHELKDMLDEMKELIAALQEQARKQ